MRFVWAVGSWKRTGPVDPSLDLAAALARRGHEVNVVLGRPDGDAADEVAEAVEARGLCRLSLGLRLARHFAPIDNRRDAARLARMLAALRPDAVVSTFRNDHRVVERARRAAGVPSRLVRLWFSDGSEAPPRSERGLLSRADAVVVFGEAPKRAIEAMEGAPKAIVVPPPLDVERLRRAVGDVDAVRRRWTPDDAFLAGIVARVQPHRRFELLWDAAAILRDEGLSFRLLVIGRGTRFERLVTQPLFARGLEGYVALAGYLRGADYVTTLAALSAQVFLVPGSDPTCRALREGMALGVPSVATRRGLLPDLVEDDRTGFLVDETPESLARALRTLIEDPAKRDALAAGAAAGSERFVAACVAERLEAALFPGAPRPAGKPMDLSGLDPTGRFSSRALDYAKFRPDYPASALDAALEGLGGHGRPVEAADVGAGTGISARLLAARGVRVVAIEPNAAMRSAAEPAEGVRWVEATAERTGLPSESFDLVLCAQSFHWFRPDEALQELARVLRPGGRLALLWNERDDSDPGTAEFSRAVREAAGSDPAASAHVRPDPLFASRWFEHAREVEHRHEQPLDSDGLVGRALSASYVPRDGPVRDRLVETLRALPLRYGDREGVVRLRYRVRLYLAEKASR